MGLTTHRRRRSAAGKDRGATDHNLTPNFLLHSTPHHPKGRRFLCGRSHGSSARNKFIWFLLEIGSPTSTHNTTHKGRRLSTVHCQEIIDFSTRCVVVSAQQKSCNFLVLLPLQKLVFVALQSPSCGLKIHVWPEYFHLIARDGWMDGCLINLLTTGIYAAGSRLKICILEKGNFKTRAPFFW